MPAQSPARHLRRSARHLRRSARHRSGHRRPSRALWAVPLLPLLVSAGFYLAKGPGAGTVQAGGTARAAVSRQAAGSCASPASPAGQASPACPRPLTRGSQTPGTSAPTAGNSAHHATRAGRPARRRSRAAPSSPGPSAAQPAASPQGPAAAQVLALINQARAAAGLPAYTLTDGLDRSSAAHSARMASGCGLSHQCPGEPSLGARESAAGVDWASAGENIGEGGPVAATNAAITQMATGLVRQMLDEEPPGDGHRLNILSSVFHHIGIAIERSSAGIVWMTQDFSN